MKFAGVILTAALVASPLASFAQTPAAQPPVATLNVGGDGLVQRSPDVAHVSLTIVTDDADATRSTSKNTTILGALKAKLAPLGLGNDALRTTFFNVDFIPDPPKNLPAQDRQPRYGYITTRTITVDVAPIENAGKIVDAATSSGATTVAGVTFDLKDRKGAYHEALVAAMKDAQSSAGALAQGADVHVGRIIRVSTSTTNFTRPLAAEGFSARMAAPSPTEIAPNGPIDVSAHVEVTFEIR